MLHNSIKSRYASESTSPADIRRRHRRGNAPRAPNLIFEKVSNKSESFTMCEC
jgi:hypothetical protein